MKPFLPLLLPITGIKWEPLIPLIGRANRSLAHYNGLLQALPNPDVLLAPLTTQEAVLSSRIEGTQATLSEVLKFEAGEEPKMESRRLDIQEILNYRRALRKAETALKRKPFHLNLLLELHDILLDSVRGQEKARGQFRTTQNWIGKPGTPIEKAQFIPPPPMAVPRLMDNWETYYHAEAPDPLVQLALVHAQFEIIHPFRDGNGRLGRILVPLFLCEKAILSRPMFYLSAYLEEHRDQYINRLGALRKTPESLECLDSFFSASTG
jgi:Fic family protein